MVADIYVKKVDVINAINNDRQTTLNGFIDQELLPYIQCCYETVMDAIENVDTFTCKDISEGK